MSLLFFTCCSLGINGGGRGERSPPEQQRLGEEYQIGELADNGGQSNIAATGGNGALPEGYRDNGDGTITGPGDGRATPTGQYDIETQSEIYKRNSGEHYVVVDGGQRSVKSPSQHGNTLNKEPTEIYLKKDADGNYLKTGISKNTETRYSDDELNGGRAIPIGVRPRDRAAKIERFIVERNPGPENEEPWAGKRDASHPNYDPNYVPAHMRKDK